MYVCVRALLCVYNFKHVCVCLSLNSCGVHGEARPHGAAPGEPINYRAVTPGRPGPVIDASCAAGEALSHAAKGKGHPADRPGWVVVSWERVKDDGGSTGHQFLHW